MKIIKIQNLNKIYHSKANMDVHALVNINLEIKEFGLVFIIGKSGCGKTTLLNILGGMDTPNSGLIDVFGKRVDDLKEGELNHYRKEEVGFIFQEYHLIENLTVKDNILLSLDIKNEKINNEMFLNLLKDLDISGLENKYINELSGGQKQRVAIARALIKKPKLLLADEPTGALDEETGHALMRTIKKISKNTTVIVVSHNIELAEKYGDRIIEMFDGTIINDSILNENDDIQEDIKQPTKKHKRMSFRSTLRMSFNGVLKRKYRLFTSLLLTIVSLSFVGLFGSFLSYDREKVFVNSMYQLENHYLPITMENPITDNKLDEINNSLKTHTLYKNYNVSSTILDFSSIENFADEEKVDNFSFNNVMEITPEIAKNLKFKLLYGSYPITDDEVVVSKYVFDLFRKVGYVDYYTKETHIVNSFDDLKNKVIGSTDLYHHFGGFKICGVIDTNYDALRQTKMDSLGAPINSSYLTGLYKTLFLNDGFNERFINQNNFNEAVTYQKIGSFSKPQIQNEYGSSSLLSISNGSSIPYTKLDSSASDLNVKYPSGILWKDDREIDKLNNDEIIVSINTILGLCISSDFTFYSQLYDEKLVKLVNEFAENNIDSVADDLLNDGIEPTIENYQNYILTKTIFTDNKYQPGFNKIFFQKDAQEYIAKDFFKNWTNKISLSKGTTYTKQVSVVGIYFSYDSSSYRFYDTAYFSDDLFSEFQEEFADFRNYTLFTYLTGNTRNDTKFLKSIKTNRLDDNEDFVDGILLYHTLMNDIVESENILKNIEMIFVIMAIIGSTFSFILIFNYFSVNIKDDYRKIGIMRTMGASKADIFRIYFIRSLSLSVLCILISILVSFVGINFINNYLYSRLLINITLLSIDISTPVLITLLAFVTVTISSIISIIMVTLKTPIEAMKLI